MLADRAPLGTLTPGTISPRRPVPTSIEYPEYVDQPAPQPFTGSEVNEPGTIERLRRPASVAAQALEHAGAGVQPGITTDELNRVWLEFAVAHGAYPPSLGYRGFLNAQCTSVNEVVCYGITYST